MVEVNFSRLRDLSPSGFKLMVYFLDQVEQHQTNTFTRPLIELGRDSGLQAPVRFPALAAGRDTQVRNALRELIERGLIEKESAQGLGRTPNSYRVKRVPR